MKYALTLVCFVLALWSSGTQAANTHGLPSTDAELRAYFGDALVPYTLPLSCAPTVPGSSLTLPAFACKAYVKLTDGELLYVSQAAAAVGPLNSGNGTYWLAAVNNTTTVISGWTRQATTHYLWKFAANQPANPTQGLVFAKVTVAGGVITAVEQLGFPDEIDVSLSGDCNSTTLQAVITLLGTARRQLRLTSRCVWEITDDLTVPANLTLAIATGAQVRITAGKTLTLAACPVIEATPGWLTVGSGAQVHITATGCPIPVQKFATGGAGTQAAPWTGWDSALVWASGSTNNSLDFHAGTHYVFACGNYTQVAKVILPYSYSYVMGEANGGPGCVHIDFEPSGAADDDGYYTAWEFGVATADGGTIYGRFENIQLWGHDLTKKKRAIHVADMKHMTIRNVSILGYDAGCTAAGADIEGLGWCDTATYGSIGVHIEGREFVYIQDSWIIANRPVYLAGTPAGKPAARNIDYNLDVTRFTNVAFWQVPNTIASLSHAAPIFFDPSVFVTDFKIDGTCSLVGGEHAIYFDQSSLDPNRQPSSRNITIDGCRTEGFVGNTYRFWFVGQSTSSSSPETLTHNLTFKNMVWAGGGVSKGYWIERIGYVLFESMNLKNANYGYDMTNMPNIALHLGENTYPVTLLNSWVVDSSFVELTGNQCIYFNSGANGRFGPFRGAPLVVIDVNDATVGCTQLAFTPTIPAFPTPPASATSPPMNAGQPFIPMLRGDTGPGSDDNVYAEQYGYWTRSGKVVTVFARIVLTTKGTWAGSVSLRLYNDAVATGNKPPPPPSALQEANQGLTVRYGNLTLQNTFTTVCVEGTPNTCTTTADAGNITQLSAVFAPHFNEPAGTEPANNPTTSGNIVFLAMGNGVANNNFLTWAAMTNTTTIEISGSYMTEN